MWSLISFVAGAVMGGMVILTVLVIGFEKKRADDEN